MQDLISHLASGADLTTGQIASAVSDLLSIDVADESKAGFLRALRQKGETADEIAAFAEALLARAINPGIEPSRLLGPMLDICGTGGDRMEFFNISTTSMFILAAGGAAVVKHGNRAITSQCGGADVLEELGIRIDLPPTALKRCVETVGLGFVFAPHYHPTFKAVVSARKALSAEGIPTIFNILGPLLNPARPPYQLVGIFSRTMLDRYAEALRALRRLRAWAVHGEGADELATTGPTDVREITPAEVRQFTIAPEHLGLRVSATSELRGGDRATNGRILLEILQGVDRGAKRDIVLLNAAAGFLVTELTRDLPSGLELAREQIESGRALQKLRGLQSFQG